MTRKRPQVADVCAMKGKYQYTILRVETMQEQKPQSLQASTWFRFPDLMCDPEFRDAAPGSLPLSRTQLFRCRHD